MEQQEEMYIQISAGRGPAECCWVVAQVLKEILNECRINKIDANVVDRQTGPENGTLLSTIIQLKGMEINDKMNAWEGTIQWIGKSPYRKFHKRKNWFVGVTIFKHKSQILNMNSVSFQTLKASGPGGQHRNKVETAIRATHGESGLSAIASEHRSQHKNRHLAIQKLKLLLEQKDIDDQSKLINNLWMKHLSLERGNAVKVFEGRKFAARK